MIKRPLFLPLVFVVLAFAFVACGGNGGNAATAAPDPATATAPPTAIGEAPTETPTGRAASMQQSATKASGVGDESEGSSASRTSTGTPQEALSTVEVVKILKPSVVQIVTEISAMGAVNQPAPSRGVGTGIIMDEEGHILTNNHVIRGAQSIMVTLNNGDSFPAELIGGDANTDTAVIKIDAGGLQPAILGRSADLEVGAEVIAIGHALGLPGGPTVSKGVVSALGRSIDVDPRITMVDLIQTDASINPGNSGGPLANARAEVIGINTAVIPGSQGIGFAINIDDAQFIAEQLLARGYVDRGFLGIYGRGGQRRGMISTVPANPSEVRNVPARPQR